MKQTILSTALLTISLTATAQTQTTNDSLALDSLQNLSLDDVTVVAQRQLVKNDIDKLTYDVQADEESKSKNLMDMLKKVPMVSIDGQDNIKVKGSSSFKIYRNGRRDPSFEGERLADVLRAIPASVIKKIEVITSPGAKEDAENTDYILNIVMLDNTRFGGLSANLSVTANQRGQNNTTVYLTTRTGKLALSGYYGFVVIPHDSQKNKSSEDYTYNNGQRYTSSQLQNIGPGTVHVGNMDLSYELDSLNLLTVNGSLQMLGHCNRGVWGLNNQTVMYAADGSLLYAYDTDIDIRDFKQDNYSASMNYQHKTHLDGEALTLSYLFYGRHRRMDTFSNYGNLQGTLPMQYTGYLNYADTRFAEHTLQLDYIRPLGDYHRLDVGAKYIDRTAKNDTRNEYEGMESSNVASLFKSSTRIAAAYAEWSYTHGHWAAQAGLRYEYSRLSETFLNGSGNDYHKNLNDWVPSMSVKYNLTDANSLKLNLSTSITRPGVDYLNPTVTENPTSISFGNISLRSTRLTHLTLDFTHVDSKFTWNLSPFYNWSNNGIGNVAYLQGDKQVKTYNDVLHMRTFGLTAYAQLSPWRGAQLMVDGMAYHTKFKNNSLGYCLGHWAGYLSGSLSQRLPWKLNLSVWGNTDIGRDVNSIYELDARWFQYGLTLQRSFLKDDRLTVILSAKNMFDPNYYEQVSKIVQGEYTGTSMWANQRPEYFLRVSLRLGKIKAGVKNVDKTIQNNDLQSGGGSGLMGGK